ncbi:MAG: IS5 family transposase [Roseovarius sp.]|nr:IS5 family transposase [Roseovarius sp.]
MDLFLREAADRIGEDDALSKIDALMEWRAFSPLLKRGLGRSGIGPQGYDPLVLFKCLLIGQWHGLSDPKLERALRVRLDFMLFCGLDLHAPVPDETTHCRFRNALVKGGIHDDLLAEVCRQLEGHGLKLKEAEAAIIDATLVEAAARPRTHIEAPQDRAEGEEPDDPEVRFSADPDARRVKKGSKSTLGYKGFARTDDEGFIERVHTTPANRAESPEFATMIEGARARRVLADKAYASKANRAALRGHDRDGIMRKAVRGRPLRALRETLQQADLQVPVPCRTMLRHHETALGPCPRPPFRRGQDSRPTGDGGDRAEPAQGREQDQTPPANPGDRITETNADRPPAERPADG